MTFRIVLRALAWFTLAFIAYATLSAIELRPRIGDAVHLERFGAFGLLGFLFATAYPRRIGIVLLLTIGIAIGLELFQMLSPDRHARLGDALVKIAGGVSGVAASWLSARLLPRLTTYLDRERLRG